MEVVENKGGSMQGLLVEMHRGNARGKVEGRKLEVESGEKEKISARTRRNIREECGEQL